MLIVLVLLDHFVLHLLLLKDLLDLANFPGRPIW